MVFVGSVGLLTAVEKVKKRIGCVSSDLLKLFVCSIIHLGQLRTLFGVCKKQDYVI